MINMAYGVIGVGNNVSYKPRWQSPHLPSPTILASGPLKEGDNGWLLMGEYEDSEVGEMSHEGKPEYKVPSMREIEELPWNGFKVVSTFSGTGGSCLGYRMAGYKVVWANEFIPAAQECYKANHPSSILDTRDIRTVDPLDILNATGLKVGELDLFDGSPPCSAFSTAGKREKGWGQEKNYSDGATQVVDDLFFEYVRILKVLQPKVFIAENVSGLVKGTAKGYFKLILQALKECGYVVEARLCDAQWLGVPQVRQRIIFMGVREDLALKPVYPNPLPYRYSVREVLPNIEGYMSSGYMNHWKSADEPYGTVMADGGKLSPTAYLSTNGYIMDDKKQHRKFTIPELKRICSFPDDFILEGNFAQQWERMGRSVPPVMMSHIAASVRDNILRKL